MTDILLSDKQVKKIIGGKSKLIAYPELAQYSSIDDLFGDCNKIILLYVNEMNDNSMVGHWCLLTRVKRGNKTIVEFQDPYGYVPDKEMDFYDEHWKSQSGQDHNYLTRLLYNFSLDPNHEVHYNELPMQKDDPNINTCGRHIGLRGHFYKIPLEQYQKIFKNLKNKGYDLDDIVTKLTNQLL